jgi:hypothetical protein
VPVGIRAHDPAGETLIHIAPVMIGTSSAFREARIYPCIPPPAINKPALAA